MGRERAGRSVLYEKRLSSQPGSSTVPEEPCRKGSPVGLSFSLGILSLLLREYDGNAVGDCVSARPASAQTQEHAVARKGKRRLVWIWSKGSCKGTFPERRPPHKPQVTVLASEDHCSSRTIETVAKVTSRRREGCKSALIPVSPVYPVPSLRLFS